MLPEVGVGLFFSNASTKILPRIIGEGRAKQLMIMGDEISAEEALSIGLVTQVVKLASLDRILKKRATSISQKSHLSLHYTKKFLNENPDNDIESTLGRESIAMIETGKSEELRKRLTKFVKKE